jgi:hypothetical protein
MDMGYLPPSLCMMELATRIDRNATARVSQYGVLRANRIFGIGDSADEDESAMPLIQGSTPAVFRMDVDSRGHDLQRQGIGDNRYSGGAPASPRNASSGESRGRYACPDHNRRKFDPSIICDACCRFSGIPDWRRQTVSLRNHQ